MVLINRHQGFDLGQFSEIANEDQGEPYPPRRQWPDDVDPLFSEWPWTENAG